MYTNKNTMLKYVLFFLLVAKGVSAQMPATKPTKQLKKWEKLKFGAFVHFNDNTFLQREFSQNTNPQNFNPTNIDFDGMMATFKKAHVKYAVLTTRHTSGFCLWDSKYTEFDVMKSAYPKDVVQQFVNACKKYGIKPCLYYCLWGGKGWQPWKWNSTIKNELTNSSAKEVILKQLAELSSNYGEIYSFWIDMQVWAPENLTVAETYTLLKRNNPQTLVHFNQNVQDGSKLKFFPTDIINGEERCPPVSGHQAYRKWTDSVTYYLPFETELTSQMNLQRSLGNGLMKGSCWFTHTDSKFYPVDSLFAFIKRNKERGGSNVLLSTAPDLSGSYRKADADSLIKLGKLIKQLR